MSFTSKKVLFKLPPSIKYLLIANYEVNEDLNDFYKLPFEARVYLLNSK